MGLCASPALAHGVGGAQSANFRSAVTGLVDPEAPDAALGGAPVAVPDFEGIEWRVLAGDAYLQVANRSAREVVVLGYELEPYLRVGPDGVFRNIRSPATYLNADRFARTRVPPEADADAEPDWRQISPEPVWAWHDHRAQWMGDGLPEEAAAAPGEEHLLAEWVTPITVDGVRVGVAGTLRWVPPVPAWPWLIAALGLLGLPVGLVVAIRRPGRPSVPRAAAAVTAAVVVVAGFLLVDELTATPMPAPGELASAATSSGALVVVAGAGAWLGWRGRRLARAGLLLSGLSLLSFGVAERAALTASNVLTSLPTPLTRIGVATTLVVWAPAALAVLRPRAGTRPTAIPSDA